MNTRLLTMAMFVLLTLMTAASTPVDAAHDEIYIVQSGDTLESIAMEYIGHPMGWWEIYTDNPGLYPRRYTNRRGQDIVKIYPGEQLKVVGVHGGIVPSTYTPPLASNPTKDHMAITEEKALPIWFWIYVFIVVIIMSTWVFWNFRPRQRGALTILAVEGGAVVKYGKEKIFIRFPQ